MINLDVPGSVNWNSEIAGFDGALDINVKKYLGIINSEVARSIILIL